MISFKATFVAMATCMCRVRCSGCKSFASVHAARVLCPCSLELRITCPCAVAINIAHMVWHSVVACRDVTRSDCANVACCSCKQAQALLITGLSVCTADVGSTSCFELLATYRLMRAFS